MITFEHAASKLLSNHVVVAVGNSHILSISSICFEFIYVSMILFFALTLDVVYVKASSELKR